MPTPLDPSVRHLIAKAYDRLDYWKLGRVYCYEGGDEFWRAKRVLSVRLGSRLAAVLRKKLARGGRSLYVGAGVAEIPALTMEVQALDREVEPYNLRREEVFLLNKACRVIPIRFRRRNAATAKGLFDHLWIVSVLNDPERFPHLSPLSYGRADPVSFKPARFERERAIVQSIVDRCLPKLSLPGFVTTTTEEVRWIADWCQRKRIPYLVERRQHPTALVGDPICFVRIGERRSKRLRA